MEQQKLDQFKKQFVLNSINNGNYLKLSDSISKGNVLRVSGYGNLDEEGFEHGFLYLQEGSELKSHVCLNNIQFYRLISGDKKIKDRLCLLGQKNGIDAIECDTIVEYFEVNRKLFGHISSYVPLNKLMKIELEKQLNKINDVLVNIGTGKIMDCVDCNFLNSIKSIYFNYEESQKVKKLN